MTEARLIVENALLKDEVRDLRIRLEACNLILARNAEELPAFVAQMARPWKSGEGEE